MTGHPVRLALTTAIQCRLGIYQPTRRPVLKMLPLSTQWGSARVTGRLGQGHRDFVELTVETAIDRGLDGMGRYCCVIDPCKLRTALSTGRDRTNWKHMKDLAKDLRNAEVSNLQVYGRPGLGVVTAGILDAVMFQDVATVEGRTGHGMQSAGRELWMVPFSPAWTILMGSDLPVDYRGKLRGIVGLRHGVSQAIARFMLSHSPGAEYLLLTALAAVGAVGPSLHHRIRELRADADALVKIGITIDEQKVRTSSELYPRGERTISPGPRQHIPGSATAYPRPI